MAALTLLRRSAGRLNAHHAISATLTCKRSIMDRQQAMFQKTLVTPSELVKALKTNAPNKISTAPRTIPLCGSWFLPNDAQKRTGRQVFLEGHIPGARFFDLDQVADTSSPYPHMMPSAETFKDAMSALGINRDDTLVVYDTLELGMFSAPRIAWTLKNYGHPAVHILNNYKLWVEQGLPTEKGEETRVEPTNYLLPELERGKVVSYAEMKSLVSDHNKEGAEEIQILDARPIGRFNGTDPEPRAGLESGHMPGAKSLVFQDVLDPDTKTFLPATELRRLFEAKGIDKYKPIISTCGTGVTAAVIDAALDEAGYGQGERRIYDGSWTEWAQRVQPSEHLIVKSK